MDGGAKPKGPPLGALLTNLAYKPLEFRAVLTVAMLGTWYAALGLPLTAGIDETTLKAGRERKRLDLAKQIEKLRDQVGQFKDRVPTATDPNEWMGYMLAGLRRFPKVKQNSLTPEVVRDLGPYKAVSLRMEVSAPYQEFEAWLRWLESNRRLLRVDSLKIVPEAHPAGGPWSVKANLVVVGVSG
jgi:hypothetical protein